MTIAARLPDQPKSREYEELVGAAYQLAGMYVERGIVRRSTVDLFELDAVVTDYSKHPPEECIVEAKSGKWGSSDLFRLRGLQDHLGAPSANLVYACKRPHQETYETLAERMGLGLIGLPDATTDLARLDIPTKEHELAQRMVYLWRFYYQAERKLIEYVKRRASSGGNQKRFKKMLAYAFRTTSGIFFAGTVADRDVLP